MGLYELIFGCTAFMKLFKQFSASWRMLEEVGMVEIELSLFHVNTFALSPLWHEEINTKSKSRSKQLQSEAIAAPPDRAESVSVLPPADLETIGPLWVA